MTQQTEADDTRRAQERQYVETFFEHNGNDDESAAPRGVLLPTVEIFRQPGLVEVVIQDVNRRFQRADVIDNATDRAGADAVR